MQSDDKPHVGICGIYCSQCPAFIATRNNDSKLKTKVAHDWSLFYGIEISTCFVYADLFSPPRH